MKQYQCSKRSQYPVPGYVASGSKEQDTFINCSEPDVCSGRGGLDGNIDVITSIDCVGGTPNAYLEEKSNEASAASGSIQTSGKSRI